MIAPSTGNCNPDIRKGAWSREEDILLRRCIQKYGEGNWHLVPARAGLRRCRKSCRLRWLNYLSPNIKRGQFSPDEDDLIIKMHRLLGNRWSLIAGRIPGRTANDIKNHWNSHLTKRMPAYQATEEIPISSSVVVKPQAHRITMKAPHWFRSASSRTQTTGNSGEEALPFASQLDSKTSLGEGQSGELGPHESQEEPSLPEALSDLDRQQFLFQEAAAALETELEWEKLFDSEFWSSLDLGNCL